MAVQIQLRRGTTAEHTTFTGVIGEITMDTTKNVAVIHNGSVAGGFPLALASGSLVSASGLFVGSNANLSNGSAYLVNGTSVLSATVLGSGVVSSSLQTLGTIGTGVWQGTAIANTYIASGLDVGKLTAGATLPSNVTASSLTSVGTLSSLTISGDLTVDTSTLKVDSTNNYVGIGTASPTNTLTVSGIARFASSAGSTQGVRVYGASGSNQWDIYTNGANLRIGDNTGGGSVVIDQGATIGGNLAVDTNTLYVDATNNRVGVGTASPSFALDVNGTARIGTGATTPALLTLFPSVSAKGWQISANNYVASALEFTPATANGGTTFTTPSMLLDISGNLGLGVTPSATSAAGYRAFELGTTAGAGITAAGGDLYVNNNAYVASGAWKYAASSVVTAQYNLSGGVHKWFTAPSGTAGNNITFTQAMTLDASGNLGVGTSPSYRFHTEASSAIALYANRTTTDGEIARFSVGGTTAFSFTTTSTTRNIVSTEAGAALTFHTANTERARITSGGLFQVTADGANQTFTNSGQIALKRSGDNPYISWHESTGARIGYMLMNASAPSYISVGANQPLVFETNNTERARITSGGYFKASNDGTYVSATSSVHEFRNTATANETVRLTHTTSGSPYGMRISYTAASPNGTDNWFLYCDDSTALRAEIRSNGGLRNYQANNVDLSDARTKTDITPLDSMWGKVAALEIVSYKYIDQTHDDVNLGVIAQQVETVEPVWVDNDGFGETPEGEEPMKTVYNKDIYFAAIKALQEAMARIEALEARLEALEA